MKKLFLLFIVAISMLVSSIGLAAPYFVDDNRWVVLDQDPTGNETWYIDKKSKIFDDVRNTASVWLLIVDKQKDTAMLNNIQFRYPVRTYAMKATIMHKYSDGSLVDSYNNPYLDEKSIAPGTMLEFIYEINDPSKQTIRREKKAYELPGSGMKITVPESFDLCFTADDVKANPTRYESLLKGVFAEKECYIYAGDSKDKMLFFVALDDILPDDIKDLREMKSEIKKEDYLQGPEMQKKIKLYEKEHPGAKVLVTDKHIAKNAIFLSQVVKVVVNSEIWYMKNYTTNRNGKYITFFAVGMDKNLVCNTTDSIFNTIEYLN